MSLAIEEYFMRYVSLFAAFFLINISTVLSKTIVFYEKDFPTIDNSRIDRRVLEQALSPLNPQFIGFAELLKKNSLDDCDLFILPYGSAFPADAWDTIQLYLNRGNLLVLGGRPFFVPVYKDSTNWRIENPQNTFARYLGILH